MSRITTKRMALALTLVVAVAAVAGTALAGPSAVKSVLNKQEKKQAKSIAENAINAAAPGLSVASAQNAQNATNALNAASARNAGNADSLGGIPPSGYTHSDCASITGQIKGFTVVPASNTFSSTFVEIGGYNCSGQGVEARRNGQGLYEVRFLGNPAGIAVGNAFGGPPTVAFITLGLIEPGHFGVSVTTPSTFLDRPFALIVP